jgi:hypothetical protein
MRRNDVLEAITRELEAAGVSHEVREGGKHLLVRWTARHLTRTLTVQRGGSGEWRASLNARADVRRMLRRDGVMV